MVRFILLFSLVIFFYSCQPPKQQNQTEQPFKRLVQPEVVEPPLYVLDYDSIGRPFLNYDYLFGPALSPVIPYRTFVDYMYAINGIDNIPVDESYYAGDDNEPNEEESNDSAIPYENFTLTFYNYKLERSDIVYDPNAETTTRQNTLPITLKDTLELTEELFTTLDNKLLQIIPKNSQDKFKVFITFEENISEIFDEKFNIPTEEKLRNPIMWTGHLPYKQLNDSAGYFFRIPEVNRESILKIRKTTFGLKDTTIRVLYTGEYSTGEVEKIKALKFKNKACGHDVPEGLLRIERYRGTKLVEKKYVSIYFSVGC